jgi:transposase
LAADQKKARKLGASICFVDQTGLSEVPTVRRTWAPSGLTPVLSHKASWTKVSVMGGLTVSPKRRRLNLYQTHYVNRAVKSPDVVEFFRDLLLHIEGPVIVVADRGNIHRSREVKRFLARATRIQLEFFPPYAPDLNPIEAVWSNLKAARLANFCPSGPRELVRGLRRASAEIRSDQNLLRGFVKSTPLSLRI